jgi:hypothetical protein
LGEGGRSHFRVVLVYEFHETCHVHILGDIGEDPEWALVLVNAVWEQHRRAVHGVEKPRV